jgi:hypothetical protein
MSEEPEPAIVKLFPYTRFYPAYRLLTWHPRGVFDEAMGDILLDFIEAEEQANETPFNRYADLGLLADIRVSYEHVSRIAQHRRTNYAGEPVKTAVMSEHPAGFGIARMYESLMEGAQLKVRAFRERAEAAEWLEVPEEILVPRERMHDPK